MNQTYIEYLYPGIITSETSVEKVKDRQIPKKFPENAFGFRFFERTEIKNGKEVLKGPAKNHSPWHYIKGEILTVEDMKKYYPEKTIAITNMENNKIKSVVKTEFGQFIPLQKEDIVLEKVQHKS